MLTRFNAVCNMKSHLSLTFHILNFRRKKNQRGGGGGGGRGLEKSP